MWIDKVCKRHVEQIMNRLPLVAGWIVYRDCEDQSRQFMGDCHSNRPGFDPAILDYLKSEAWLGNELPVLQLTLLPPSSQCEDGKDLAERSLARKYQGLKNNFFAYIFVMPNRNLVKNIYKHTTNKDRLKAKADEYLLLWTQTELSDPDKEMIGQEAQLLYDYITVCRECDRQREEIQLLEQVVRRGEHQLRNPLALLALYAENLCLGLPPGHFQDQAMVIRETLQDLNANLTNLLSCGQEAKLRVSVYNLRDILVDSIKVLQPKLTEKKLEIRYPQASVILSFDRWQIKQVFENILNNAIDFSPVGGAISCNWQLFETEVLVEISDTGSGLSPEDLQEGFTPFYSRREGGTGLGLTIAKKIILDHQGSIWMENLPTGGAMVCFTLPRQVS